MIDKLLKLADDLDEKGQPIIADEIDKLAEAIVEADKVAEDVVEVKEEVKPIHGGGVHIF